MRKDELLRLVGSMEQVASVRPVTYADGRAAGLRCALVKSGPLSYSLMLDKCLDLASLSYKGINLSFLSKPGLQGRNHYDTSAGEAGRSIMGGAMFTCGLRNIHHFRVADGREHPLHGRIRTTPAEKVSMDAAFRGEDYVLTVSGEMREAELFQENLVLRRTVSTVYGTPELVICDEVENQDFREEPLCLLYHCNAAYPLLAPGSRVILPSLSCAPRDADAEAGMEKRFSMEAPRDNAPEQVFLHRMAADEAGNTFGAVVNDALGLALVIRWNTCELPLLTQWKSLGSGDYVMALEPTNTGLEGRACAARRLAPLETCRTTLRLAVAEGRDAIALLEAEAKKILEGCKYV